MGTQQWDNGQASNYDDAADWASGTAPAPGDTAVISSNGDPAPTAKAGLSDEIFAPVTGESAVGFFTGEIANGDSATNTVYVQQTQSTDAYSFTYPLELPTLDQIPQGDDITDQMIDFEGAGSAADATMQRSTFDATTTVNVSGIAVFEQYYDNTLAGLINVGGPFSVDGTPVAEPAADANGFTSELDLELNLDGSYQVGQAGTLANDLTLSGYVPTTTNTGTITVAGGSALRIDTRATAGGAFAVAGIEALVAPGSEAFDNEGTISVAPGGSFGFYSSDAMYYTASSGASIGEADIPPDTILATFINNGVLWLQGGQGVATQGTIEGAVTGTGDIVVNGGGGNDPSQTELVLTDARVDNNIIVQDGTVAWSNTVAFKGVQFTAATGGSFTFADTQGVLDLSDPGLGLFTPFGMPVVGFRAGDTINLSFEVGISQFPQSFIPVWDQTTKTLSMQEIYTNIVGTPTTTALMPILTLDGTYGADDFSTSFASGTSEFEYTVTLTTGESTPGCFCGFTRILTDRGEIAVEHLRVGDTLPTVAGRCDGARGRIRWIGHRTVACRAHPRPWDVRPVRIGRGAFGDSLPRRDLWLSPDHAVFVEGVLIPVRYLLNGRTIAQEACDTVTYWHVELDRHDAILAEGLPCETYLDTGNRGAFAGSNAVIRLHPDFARHAWRTQACAPLVHDGARLEAVRRRLLDHAESLGHARTDDPALRVQAEGRTLAARIVDRRWTMRLPARTRRVRLVSRAAPPAHTRPAGTDTRCLGVAIGRLWLDGRDVPLDSPRLIAGWHAPEPAWRWTNGNAEVATDGARDLACEVAITGTYWLRSADALARAA